MKLPKQPKSFKKMREQAMNRKVRPSFSSIGDLRAAKLASDMQWGEPGVSGGSRLSSDGYDRWGNYRGPLKKDKGAKNGSCNREACQRPRAVFYNHGMDKYYCESCARMLNDANRDAVDTYGHPLCTLDPDFI